MSELAKDIASYFDEVLEERKSEMSFEQVPCKKRGTPRPERRS